MILAKRKGINKEGKVWPNPSSVDKLRQIDDHEKAEQYFNENWNSLLKEEWERQDRQRK